MRGARVGSTSPTVTLRQVAIEEALPSAAV